MLLGTLLEAPPTFDDPLGMLQACHRRIEQALATVSRVADRELDGPLDEAARNALRQVLHYFAVGVPRHAADEEQSLFPRLQRAVGDTEPAAYVIEQLEWEHVALDTAHRHLSLLGEALLRTGHFESDRERADFRRLLHILSDTYARHIQAEDEALFPLAVGTLSTGELEEMGSEMAARRGLDWSQQRHVVAQLRQRPWMQPLASGTRRAG